MNDAALKEQLSLDEGVRTKLYTDTMGKITGGIGHNFTDDGIPPIIIDALYDYDVSCAEASLIHYLPWWQNLDDVRQRALMDMCFNLGIIRLMTFTTFLNLMAANSFTAAAQDLRGTLYTRQLPKRSAMVANMIETGVG